MATRGKLRDVTVPRDTARDIGRPLDCSTAFPATWPLLPHLWTRERNSSPWIIRTPTGLRFTFSRLWRTMSGK